MRNRGKGFAGTCLTQAEWTQALDDAAALRARELGRIKLPAGQPATDERMAAQSDEVLQSLVRFAQADPGYARWAAANYAGIRHHQMSGLPDQLEDKIYELSASK